MLNVHTAFSAAELEQIFGGLLCGGQKKSYLDDHLVLTAEDEIISDYVASAAGGLFWRVIILLQAFQIALQIEKGHSDNGDRGTAELHCG